MPAASSEARATGAWILLPVEIEGLTPGPGKESSTMRSSTILRSLPAALLAALVLTACGSADVDDILAGPNGDNPVPRQVGGTVRSVDARNCVIELDDATARDFRDDHVRGGSRYGDHTTLYCDNDTTVAYQGRVYRPDALEPGDQIRADVDDYRGRLVVRRIDVTYDVSYDRGNRYPDAGPGSTGSGTYDSYQRSDLRGTVRSIDREDRAVVLERVQLGRDFPRDSGYDGRDDRVTLYYDPNTTVLSHGERVRAEDLDAGDVIEVDVDSVRGTLVAQQIDVVSDVRDSSARYPQRR
jgi:hypothetical protein